MSGQSGPLVGMDHPNLDICVWPEGPHACEADTRGCMPCKLRAWRTNGGLGVHYPYGGREVFHGPTIGERQREAVADARRMGIEPEPVGTRPYAGPVK